MSKLIIGKSYPPNSITFSGKFRLIRIKCVIKGSDVADVRIKFTNYRVKGLLAIYVNIRVIRTPYTAVLTSTITPLSPNYFGQPS